MARSFARAQVQRLPYSSGWLPIGRSPRGRDILCIDYTPTKRGVVGQIILVVADGDDRPHIAKSFADLLAVYLKQAKRGELAFES